MEVKKYSKELHIIWFIFSFFVFIILLILFVFDSNVILDFTPKCTSLKNYNRECILCGMTRAFIKISNFKISEAYQLNKGSIALFGLFFANVFFFLLLKIKSVISKM